MDDSRMGGSNANSRDPGMTKFRINQPCLHNKPCPWRDVGRISSLLRSHVNFTARKGRNSTWLILIMPRGGDGPIVAAFIGAVQIMTLYLVSLL